MTNADIILNVGSVDCNDGVNTELMAMTLGKPARTAAEYGGPTVDIAAAGSVDTSQLVESRFTVQVYGASVDAISAIVASIAAEVRDLSDITVGLAGSAYTGTLKVRIGECVEIPLDKPMNSALMNAHWTRIEIVVRREPYVGASTETLHSAAAVSAPAVVDLSAQTGQFDAPLDLLLEAGALELDACYVAHHPDSSAVLADFMHQAVDLSWSAGAAAEDAAGYPDLPVPDPSPTGSAWPLTWTVYPSPAFVHADSGKYHVEDDASAKNSYMRSVDFIDVLPSTSYTIGCFLAMETLAAAGSIVCYVMWYTADGTLISQDNVAGLNSVTGEAWADVDITSPATAAKAALVAQCGGSTGATAATVRGFDIRQRLTLWGHTAAAYADIDVTAYEPGEYLVLARCKGTVANTATIGFPYAAATPIPSTTLHLLPLGVVSLPTSAVRGSAASTLRITLTGGGGGNEGYVNAVYLLPTSFGGLIGWKKASGHAHAVYWQGGLVYADGAADLASAYAARRIRALGGSLIVLAEQATPADSTALALSVFEKPRWEQFPAVTPEMTFAALVNDELADAVAPTAEAGGVYL